MIGNAGLPSTRLCSSESPRSQSQWSTSMDRPSRTRRSFARLPTGTQNLAEKKNWGQREGSGPCMTNCSRDVLRREHPCTSSCMLVGDFSRREQQECDTKRLAEVSSSSVFDWEARLTPATPCRCHSARLPAWALTTLRANRCQRGLWLLPSHAMRMVLSQKI